MNVSVLQKQKKDLTGCLTMDNLIQLDFEFGLSCLVDIEKHEVYNMKMKKLKPGKLKWHTESYITIKRKGKKLVKPLNWYIMKALEKKNEILQREN